MSPLNTAVERAVREVNETIDAVRTRLASEAEKLAASAETIRDLTAQITDQPALVESLNAELDKLDALQTELAETPLPDPIEPPVVE